MSQTRLISLGNENGEIKTDELELNPDITTVVVPNRDWEDWLQKQHEARNMRRSLLLHGLFGPRSVVKQPWHYLV